MRSIRDRLLRVESKNFDDAPPLQNLRCGWKRMDRFAMFDHDAVR
jgi:hypothetical protein